MEGARVDATVSETERQADPCPPPSPNTGSPASVRGGLEDLPMSLDLNPLTEIKALTGTCPQVLRQKGTDES